MWWFLKKKWKQSRHMILQNQSGYISRRTKSRISKSYLYTCIQSSIVHSSQKVRATQVSGGGWRNKQNVAETHSGRTALREGNSAMCYNGDEPRGHYARWNKQVTKKQQFLFMVDFYFFNNIACIFIPWLFSKNVSSYYLTLSFMTALNQPS